MFDRSRIVKLQAHRYRPVSSEGMKRQENTRDAVQMACLDFRLYPGTTTERALLTLSESNVTGFYSKSEAELRIHTSDRSLGDCMEALAAHLMLQERYTAFVNYSLLANLYTLVVQHRVFALRTLVG